MRYNQLGNTGMFVSELCLGTMTFGAAGQNAQWGLIASLDQKGVNEIVAHSLAAGVNFFDTADVYSFGESERLLGQSLRDLKVNRQNVVIATKAHGAMGDGPNQRGSSRGHIMDSVDACLKRLQLDHIDLYQLHGTDTVTPIDETLRALDDLVASGKVRYVGVSNWAAWRIAKALGIAERKGFARFETVQSYYSIAGRDLEREIVPLLNEEKLGLMVWSPMAGGLLSGKYGPGAPGNGEGRRA
ncbi:MAG: aldo/keto reductase, partial [Mesorhizobium sp.]